MEKNQNFAKSKIFFFVPFEDIVTISYDDV